MKEFTELLEIAHQLNHPDEGCPWDLKQTFVTLRSYILEEAHEALEAIDLEDDALIIEELGDLFYTVIFYAKVAERENRFSMKHIIETLKAKLIRRHPHIFGEKKGASMQEVIQNWERIKKEEKIDRKSVLDGIPKTLPSLQRAHKSISRMKKKGYPFLLKESNTREEELAKQIFSTIEKAVEEGIDIESAFRNFLTREEENFKSWEQRWN